MKATSPKSTTFGTFLDYQLDDFNSHEHRIVFWLKEIIEAESERCTIVNAEISRSFQQFHL